MLKIKSGVQSGNPLLAAIIIAESIYTKYGYECVITSLNDGKHMQGSKHYTDDGVDLRTKNISEPSHKELIKREITEALGKDYDIIFEDRGGVNEHLHIEYDRK